MFMILVFFMGLIVGTVVGLFGWIAAAALIQSKREKIEGISIGVAIQPEIAAATPASRGIFRSVERTRRFLHARRARPTIIVETPAATKKQPPEMR